MERFKRQIILLCGDASARGIVAQGLLSFGYLVREAGQTSEVQALSSELRPDLVFCMGPLSKEEVRLLSDALRPSTGPSAMVFTGLSDSIREDLLTMLQARRNIIGEPLTLEDIVWLIERTLRLGGICFTQDAP